MRLYSRPVGFFLSYLQRSGRRVGSVSAVLCSWIGSLACSVIGSESVCGLILS